MTPQTPELRLLLEAFSEGDVSDADVPGPDTELRPVPSGTEYKPLDDLPHQLMTSGR